MIRPGDPENPEKTGVFGERAALRTAVGARSIAADCDLAEVVERWPELPEPIRLAVLALVRSTGARDFPHPEPGADPRRPR